MFEKLALQVESNLQNSKPNWAKILALRTSLGAVHFNFNNMEEAI